MALHWAAILATQVTVEPTAPDSPKSTAHVEPLDAIEARILGCLVEKAATTSEVYPLTINAVVAACNQKTSRDPLMHLEPGAVAHALREMEGRGLVRIAPSSQRALRYEHRFDTVYGVTTRQRAALCVMLLRGPQTLGELLTRTERLAEFPGLDDVRDTLDRLIQREPAMVVRLGRAPSQREDRYMHLLGGPIDPASFAGTATAPSTARGDLAERVAQLEAEVAGLHDEIAALREQHRNDAS